MIPCVSQPLVHPLVVVLKIILNYFMAYCVFLTSVHPFSVSRYVACKTGIKFVQRCSLNERMQRFIGAFVLRLLSWFTVHGLCVSPNDCYHDTY